MVNAQQQARHKWPAEPVVARAYIDQLLRSEVLDQSQLDELNTALDRAEELIASDNNDRRASRSLQSLAVSLEQESKQRQGTTRKRYTELAVIVDEIARRIR